MSGIENDCPALDVVELPRIKIRRDRFLSIGLQVVPVLLSTSKTDKPSPPLRQSERTNEAASLSTRVPAVSRESEASVVQHRMTESADLKPAICEETAELPWLEEETLCDRWSTIANTAEREQWGWDTFCTASIATKARSTDVIDQTHKAMEDLLEF